MDIREIHSVENLYVRGCLHQMQEAIDSLSTSAIIANKLNRTTEEKRINFIKSNIVAQQESIKNVILKEYNGE